jgi:hypothetical protein
MAADTEGTSPAASEEAPPTRAELIERLETLRGRPLISVITSTRTGYSWSLADDLIPVIYKHLEQLRAERDCEQLDLYLHTNGGDTTFPWRLMSLLREFAKKGVDLLVPHRCFSAGTLVALGADKVVMHPMGVLGPTDTMINGPFNPTDPEGEPLPIPVEDVLSYIEWVKADVGIRHEDELVRALGYLTETVQPLALGTVKRSTLQSKMIGAKLLNIRSEAVDQHHAEEIVSTLAQRLFYHGHPISRTEARDDLHMKWVDDAPDHIAAAMWDLYESYAEDMQLHRDFLVTREALATLGKLPERPKYKGNEEPPPEVTEVELDPLQLAWVESRGRADCREQNITVDLTRSARGMISSSYVIRSSGGWDRRR